MKLQKLSGEIGLCPICYVRMDEDPSQATGNTMVFDETNTDGDEIREPMNNSKKTLKKCMKTPCNHFYHGICLKQWMDQKMECPSCRATLPPY